MDGEIKTVFVDGLPCRLLWEEDFPWLKTYGRVRRVWDQSFSGVLTFGVEGPYGRLMVKYAGAWTVNGGRPSDAVARLYQAAALYELGHPSLLKPLARGEAGRGYAVVLPWPDAEVLAENRDAARRLLLERQLKMLDGVFDLHARLAENGYVTGGFSDANMLLDLERDRAVLWDVDLYRRKPAFNDRGRMWGDSLFLAPEEYAYGAPLDETTVAFHMGALAFTFFGDNRDRSRAGWIGPGALYPLAERACREKKEQRPPSVRAFLDAWRETVGRLFR